MKIIIIGAGIAGLSCATCLARKGHTVTVLEESKALSEYGAGLQISPNAIRVLEHWGLKADLEKVAFAPRRTFMRRYSSGGILSTIDQNPLFERRYGFPYWQIYRPDLQRVLFEAVQKQGAKVEFGRKVIEVDVMAATCLLDDGTGVSGDLIIGADGINSRTRSYVLGDSLTQLKTLPDSVYRAVIPRSKMMQHKMTAEMMHINAAQFWVGPGRALLAYPIARGQLYNIAITAAGCGNGPAGRWNTPVDKKELQEMFQNFCPEVRSLLDLTDKCAKWTIAEVPSLPQWSSNSAKVVLVGDAAHAMSPHVAQGAAMAIEDAAVLSSCLDVALSTNDLQRALKEFENIRRPRTDRVAELARENGASMLLEDGPEQLARDERLKMAARPQPEPQKMIARESVEANMFAKWPQPALMKWLYGYNVLSSE